jgi:hypothetical protein
MGFFPKQAFVLLMASPKYTPLLTNHSAHSGSSNEFLFHELMATSLMTANKKETNVLQWDISLSIFIVY